MQIKNNIYVISLTHWDREWRFPYEKTRMLLVEMMDGLLDLLDNDPDYACFHLDGHTILLDDYCEVRPENKEKIRNNVKQGRLMIGPWFVLPEENQMSGESLVRNFLLGERIGQEYGGNMKVGYSPTSWGQVSQMPQIMNGFDIDNIIFYRGISSDQVNGNYYIWQGPDGSKLLGIKLGDYARVSFFHLVDRPVAFNRKRGQEFHEWNQGGKPFRISSTGSASPYHFYQPPMGWFPEKIGEAFEDLEQTDLGEWETPYALAMECDDSTGPFALTPRIIKEANKLVTNGKKILHGNLPEFVAMAKEYLNEKDLTVIEGEMRSPQRAGVLTDLYAVVQATRLPMKYANRRAEFSLQRIAEPISTLAWTLGAKFPQFAMDRAYYLLLQNHAHDSIGGCGRDAVNDDVENRFKHVEILASTMTENAFREIAGRIDTHKLASDDILIVVFNTLAQCRTEVVLAEIDIEKNRKIKGFKVCELDGQELSMQTISKNQCSAIFNHPDEAPCRMESDRWELYFEAKDLPAMGYRVFKIVPAKGEYRHVGTMLTSPVSIANEHLEVKVNSNGTVDILNKQDGTVLKNQNLFEDRGDVGDYWVEGFPLEDRIINSNGCNATIAIIESGPISTAIEVGLRLELPIRAKQDISAREKETKLVNIKTIYRLVRGEKFLRIKTTVENTVEDHILRVLFPTGVETDIVHVETPFDVVERVVSLPDTRDWREPYRPVQPQQNFVDLYDGKKGVAILNRGLPQYEAVDDKQRTVALTLLRAHRAWNSIRLAHYPDQIGTQLQGTYTFEYAILPHTGNWESADVMHEAEKFNISPIVAAAGSGNGELPTELSFIEVDGKGLVVSAVKKGEWDDSIIVRVSNPTSKEIKGLLKLNNQYHVKKAFFVKLNEVDVEEQLCIKDNGVDIDVPSKKVMTIKLFQ